VSSSRYDGNSAKQRLTDIAERFRLIRQFIEGLGREEFLRDTMREYAVVRALEEACEAAYWFTKHQNGAEVRKRHPEVDFARFGAAGNLFRHAYGTIDYGIVWDDILGGPDVAAMESLLEAELPFYQRNFHQTARPETADETK
jgi:uncharacterized protein with HEPN domain